jgi:putative transposase
MQQAVTDLAGEVGVTDACQVLGVPRSTYYRTRQAAVAAPPTAPARAASRRALTSAERAQVRAVLNSERFADCAPREVYATLLDEGMYLCSWSTMYRILREAEEVKRRRDQVRRTAYAKPELLATQPNQLWSWDITKLKGATTWSYYYLYVILDVYSRYVVGWMIAERETAELAEAFIAETCAQEQIDPNQLTIHADRGSAMTSKCVAHLLADLGVTKTHSRPHVSDDNPFSEAQFKTVKYHPTFPERFGSVADARAWARRFFHWYNEEHHHTGIALLTPATVHHGRTATVRAARQAVLTAAYAAHPERFVRGQPQPAVLPPAVWINPPAPTTGSTSALSEPGTERRDPAQPAAGPASRGVTAQRPLDAGPALAMLGDTGRVAGSVQCDAPKFPLESVSCLLTHSATAMGGAMYAELIYSPAHYQALPDKR